MGSEMCIRDRDRIVIDVRTVTLQEQEILVQKLAAVMKERVE